MIRSQREPITSEQPLIMPEPDQAHSEIRPVAVDAPPSPSTPQIMLELVIEEVSIDGMCGVY